MKEKLKNTNIFNGFFSNSKYRYIVSLFITILGILSLIGGTSYAILKGSTTSSKEQIIKTGSIKLKLTENFESIDKTITTMKDSDGLLQTGTYEFNIKNVGDAPAQFDLKLVNEVPSDYTGNVLDTKYIKIGLEINGEEYGPMSLEDVNNIIDSDVIYENEIINYILRIWLDEDQKEELAELEDYKAFLKLDLEAEQRVESMDSNLDKSRANVPVLSENMIPVYYDETDEVWKKADNTNSDETYQWYDYNEKMWANSVTVSEDNRSTYLSAAPGTEIPMADILTMQVWIPRYKYKIFNYNSAGTTYVDPQEIEITFESGKSSTGEITCTDSISGTDGAASETCKLKSTSATCTDNTCNGKTYTHPAFTFGDEELKGIWVGKFEVSAPETSTCYTSASSTNCNVTGITPLVKPNVMSYRYAQIGTFETNIMAMNDSGNQYGFNASDDTHMIKNIEWGAVAYLSQSKYGINKEININNSLGYYTGRSGGNVGGQTPINETYTDQTSTEKYNTYGFYTYDGYLLEYGTNKKSSTKDKSKIASTTGNIYGIYDMSGGTWEYVMGNVVSNDGTTMMSGNSTSSNSGYTGIIYASGNYTSYTGTYNYPADKYLDKYSFGTSDTQKKRSKLGDAVKEVTATSSTGWYSDYGYVASSSNPWFVRGGRYSSGTVAGVFASSNNGGSASSNTSARVVLVP